jgi:hypothetical protein
VLGDRSFASDGLGHAADRVPAVPGRFIPRG